MKLKPIDPEKEKKETSEEPEKKEKNTTKSRSKKSRSFGDLWLRIGILFAIVIVGFMIVKGRTENRASGTPSILGTEKESEHAPSTRELASDIVTQMTDTSTYVAGDVLGAATEFASETKKDITDSATKLIVDVAVNNVITQIEKLPGVDREQVKKYICE